MSEWFYKINRYHNESQIKIVFMNIYVSNLSFRTSEADLKDLFAKFGTVTSAKIITDRETGRSKGFGFIEMPDDEAAKKAISEANGAELYGRTIVVNEAEEKKERSSGGFRSSNRPAGGGGGYYCEIRIYPKLKMASALLRNKSSFRDLRLLDKIDSHFISTKFQIN